MTGVGRSLLEWALRGSAKWDALSAPRGVYEAA
jgi:hypothetical protein